MDTPYTLNRDSPDGPRPDANSRQFAAVSKAIGSRRAPPKRKAWRRRSGELSALEPRFILSLS
jgi:hypothetical protein